MVTADADYLPLEVDVEFTEVDSSCYSVTILDDDVVETPEFFSVELTNVVGFQEVLQGEFTISIIPDLDSEWHNYVCVAYLDSIVGLTS